MKRGHYGDPQAQNGLAVEHVGTIAMGVNHVGPEVLAQPPNLRDLATIRSRRHEDASAVDPLRSQSLDKGVHTREAAENACDGDLMPDTLKASAEAKDDFL
jgi:hypothetical protein